MKDLQGLNKHACAGSIQLYPTLDELCREAGISNPCNRLEAATFFWKYGNVGRSVEELVLFQPTDTQLSAACERALCHGQSSGVVKLAREAIQREPGTALPSIPARACSNQEALS